MNIPETFFSVREQLLLFALSCLGGAVIGVYYDVFRTLRTVLPHNFLLVAFEDVLFLMGWAVFTTAFSSAAARGELRFYYLIGNLLGFIVYLLTVGSAVIRTIRKLCSLLRGVFNIIIRPFKSLYVLICKKYGGKFVGSSKILIKAIKKSGKDLRKHKVLLYNKKANNYRQSETAMIKRKNVKHFGKKSKTKEN